MNSKPNLSIRILSHIWSLSVVNFIINLLNRRTRVSQVVHLAHLFFSIRVLSNEVPLMMLNTISDKCCSYSQNCTEGSPEAK